MNDSVRIRTDTTIDLDCVLKANVHVCTACMVVSVFDNMSEFDEHEDTMCEKKLCKNSKRTTGAEDTQNQHYQRVLTVADTPSQTERDSFVEEVFMMSAGSAECDAVREVLESPIYRDYNPTLHRRRSINQPDEPIVTVTEADNAIHLDLSTVCVVDAKSAFLHSIRESTDGEFCFVRRSMQASRAKCRWVPHDSMIADALTKRRGNSVTMLKFVKTGQLSIVDEDKELAERHQFWAIYVPTTARG